MVHTGRIFSGVNSTTGDPEPGSFVLSGIGFMGLLGYDLKKMRDPLNMPDFLIGLFSVQVTQICYSITELYYEFLVS